MSVTEANNQKQSGGIWNVAVVTKSSGMSRRGKLDPEGRRENNGVKNSVKQVTHSSAHLKKSKAAIV